MHYDGRELENNTIIEGDLCIIGAGVAGISIALEWINTPFKIILLEGGGFEYDEKVQELYDGKITGQNYYPMMSSRLHYFGGTSGHWGGICGTLDPSDFIKKDWVNESGWPINRDDLDPYYKRAEPILDLKNHQWDVDYCTKLTSTSVPLPFDNTAIWNKIFQESPPTRFGKKYKETITNAANIHLYTYANATDLKTNGDISNITEVTVKNYAGKTHRIKAKKFVLACSAIQNARLLLASNKQAVAGIGNKYDLVGRYFMEHLEIKTGELWLNDASPLSLYNWNQNMRAELAVSFYKQKEFRILNGTISLNELDIEQKKKANMDMWSEKDPRKSLESFKKYTSQAYYKTISERLSARLFSSKNQSAYGTYTRMEQEPNPSSRVTLNDEIDSLGVPRVDLHWALSSVDKKSIRQFNQLLGQQVGIANIGRVKLHDFLLDESDDTMPKTTSGGWHHMGTTRMSSNPQKGVVDAHCQVYGINNLFVAGSSCFVTSGAVTPTFSIVALSLRLSDHLKQLI